MSVALKLISRNIRMAIHMVILTLANEILKCKIKFFRMSSIDMQHLTTPNEKQKWAMKYRILTFCQKKREEKNEHRA